MTWIKFDYNTKKCGCGGFLQYVGTDFKQISFLSNNVFGLKEPKLEVDLCICTKCGKISLFTKPPKRI